MSSEYFLKELPPSKIRDEMKRLQLFYFLLCFSGFTGNICAQAPVEDAAYWEYAKASFPQLKELLAIPNDAHFPKDIERNVQWCEAAFYPERF